MIDFNDPAQTTHQGQPIPIDSQAEYDKARSVMQTLYDFAGVAWTATADEALEQRVRNGQTPKQIVGYTVDEFLTRTAD